MHAKHKRHEKCSTPLQEMNPNELLLFPLVGLVNALLFSFQQTQTHGQRQENRSFIVFMRKNKPPANYKWD